MATVEVKVNKVKWLELKQKMQFLLQNFSCHSVMSLCPGSCFGGPKVIRI